MAKRGRKAKRVHKTKQGRRLRSIALGAAAAVAAAMAVAPLGTARADHLFNPPEPWEFEWVGEEEWRGSAPHDHWEVWDPLFTRFLINHPDFGIVPGPPGGDDDHRIFGVFEEILPDDPSPDGGRPVFTDRGNATVVVDAPSPGKTHWEVFEISFRDSLIYEWEAGEDPDPDADPPDPGEPPSARILRGGQISHTISGLPIYLGTGGMTHTGALLLIQTFENEIWITDDVTINAYTNFAGDRIVTTFGGQANDLTFQNLSVSLNTVIQGDGNVTYAYSRAEPDLRLVGIFQDQEYTGHTTLDGAIVALGSNQAFGQNRDVFVTGLTRFIAVEEGGVTGDNLQLVSGPFIAQTGGIDLDYDIHLNADLEFGGFELLDTAPITLSGAVNLLGGDRTLIVHHGVSATLDGLVDLDEHTLTVNGFGESRMNVTGTIEGSGGLIKEGPGTLSLLNANNYSGDTIFRDGIVEIGSNNAFGNSENVIVEGRTFVRAVGPISLRQDVELQNDLEFLSDSDAFTFNAPIAVTSNAALRVQTDAPVTVSSSSGIDLAADFTVRGSGALNVNAPITGTGNLIKRGTGELWLNEDSDFAGDIDVRERGTLHVASGTTIDQAGHTTTVREATLRLHPGATLVSDNVVIDRFATLYGDGEIDGNLTADRRAIVRIGETIGTLDITGDATFQGDPRFDLGVAGAQTFIQFEAGGGSDTISVGGTAEVQEGAKFLMSQVGGGFAVGGDRYVLLEAGDLNVEEIDGLVSLSSPSSFLRFDVLEEELEQNNLVVLSHRDPFETAAQGRNNISLSRALDELAMSNPSGETVDLLIAFDAAPTAEAFNENLRQLSPAAYTGTVTAGFQMTRGYHSNIHEQTRMTRQGRRGVGYDQYNFAQALDGLQLASSGPSSQATASAQPYIWDDAYQDRLRTDDTPRTQRPSGRRDALTDRDRDRFRNLDGGDDESRRWNVFATGYGLHDSVDSSEERAGLRAITGGFVAGVDYSFTDNFFLGLSAGYSLTDISFREGRGDGDINSIRVGPYAGFGFDQFFVDASATYGLHDNSYDQNIEMNGFSATKEASFDAHDISLHVSGGYDYRLANQQTSLIPLAAVDYIHYRRDAFTETGGGPTNFEIDSQTINSLEATLGMRFEHRYYTDGATFIPNLFVGYSHEFLADDNEVTGRFTEGTQPFTVSGPGPDRSSIRAGAGLRTLLSENFQGYLQYDGRFQSNEHVHALSLGVSLQF